MFNLYAYGIDLAESLNYCAIIVTHVTDRVRLKTIRKLGGPDNPISYPIVQAMLQRDLFAKYPPAPGLVAIDYTNEKSVSEAVEAWLNPQFIQPASSDYRKWYWVDPVVFSDVYKLAAKQNSRRFMETGAFVWPARGSCGSPIMEALVYGTDGLYDQVMRESGSPGRGQVPLTFKKPQGRDNDLAMALELNLWVLRRMLDQLVALQHGGDMPGGHTEIVSGSSDADYFESAKTPEERAAEAVIGRALGMPGVAKITDIRVNGGRVKLPEEQEAEERAATIDYDP